MPHGKIYGLMEPILIVLIVVGCLALVAGVFLILHFTVFRHIWAKKQVGDLSRRFEYLHALLFGQDSQYIKRIENISVTNLLYVNTHMEFKRRFKDVRDQADSAAQSAINGLKDMLSDHRYKALKEAIPHVKKTVDYYENQVNQLNDDLLKVIKPEEEVRQQSLQLKEQLRKIKQDYYVKQADLSLVSASFEKVFTKLDEQFRTFESYVESAQYKEASDMLPTINGVLNELGKALKDLPNLCVTIQSVVPDKLSSLRNSYEDLVHAGYPLYPVFMSSYIDEMQTQLDDITNDVKNFELAGASQRLDGIIAKIDEYVEAFAGEKDARIKFESKCDEVYRLDSEIEKKYLRLCNAMSDIRRIYVISAEEQKQIDDIKTQINKSGATRRSLDTLIHSNAKQPYSSLLEKMNELEDEAKKSSAAIDEFTQYLYSLKKDSEDACDVLNEYYFTVAKCEATLREASIPVLNEKYAPTLERMHEIIDAVHKDLSSLPIDVAKVNSLISELKGKGDTVSAELQNRMNAKTLADAAILYGNRARPDLSDMAAALSQAEALYFRGDFKNAYEVATDACKRYRGE